MKPVIYFLSLLLLLGSASCGKIELEESTPDKPGTGVGGGDVDPDKGQLPDGVISVSALCDEPDDADVVVAGYIVGYVPANHTLKTMVFGTTDAVETNIVISDASQPSDYTRCAAVQLTKDTEPRSDLNLAEHPENFGAYILVAGVKAKYFGAPGVKSVYDYRIVENPSSGNPTDPDPEIPSTPSAAYPVLSDDAAVVFEGC